MEVAGEAAGLALLVVLCCFQGVCLCPCWSLVEVVGVVVEAPLRLTRAAEDQRQAS